ncbi:hypothetical protein [Salinicola rhizosphaerae]|uniref:Uncharacterized protein n=1 Tax=Salinicola rhizosphaerae TaxID=1443141 RepID=A0ABQ3E1S4_9GAMM|nr:hypothetical protein [Salinicola rhizosphaerae]GHB18231.1 hypothetical protein GCM10009038_16580 [Salinicola rhizosphaerae]
MTPMAYRTQVHPLKACRFGTYRINKHLLTSLVAVGATLPLAAEAYVGPGAGLSLLTALWGIIAAIGMALFFVIMWPIRRMRRRRKAEAAAAAGGDSAVQARTTHTEDDPETPPTTSQAEQTGRQTSSPHASRADSRS